MRYCSHCDGLHCPKTYENQVAMPINGRVVDIDRCIHHIVARSMPGECTLFLVAVDTPRYLATSFLGMAGC